MPRIDSIIVHAGPQGPQGPPTITTGALTSDYDQTIRQTGPRGGPYQLLFRRTKEAYLNDRSDIDATGAADMGATVTTYLSEFAAAGVRIVYLDRGTVLTTTTAIQVPGKLALTGPEGGINSFTPASAQAVIKAAASNIPVLRLTGSSTTVRGITVDGGSTGGFTGNVAIQPESYLQRVQGVMIQNGDATATAIKGGGLLYFYVDDLILSSWAGRGLDCINAYAIAPAGSYYGINVGWIRRSVLGCGKAAVRFEGHFDILDNDFESSASEPQIMVGVSGAYAGGGEIARNYFELTGTTSQAILIDANSVADVHDNSVSGTAQSTVGSYFLKKLGASSSLRIVNNGANRFETGIDLGTGVASGGYMDVHSNYMTNVTTKYANGPAPYSLTPRDGLRSGPVYQVGATAGGVVSVTSGTTVDFDAGNRFHVELAGTPTLTPANIKPGQVVHLYFASSAVLPNGSWNLLSGANETVPVGATKQFVVFWRTFGNGLTVREIGPRRLLAGGSAPAIAAGTGAGTTPTVSISGADMAGTITVTTGTSPTASATVATVTFAATYDATPKAVLIDPCGVNSAALTGTGRVYEDQASRTAATFALKVGSTALAASTTYLFAYQVIG